MVQTTKTVMGTFDANERNLLRSAYELALNCNMEYFEFNGQEYDVYFAKFLLEHLDLQLDN